MQLYLIIQNESKNNEKTNAKDQAEIKEVTAKADMCCCRI